MVPWSTTQQPRGSKKSYTSSAISSSCSEVRGQLHDLMLDLVPDFPHLFQRSALGVVQMPLDQFFLHLSNDRLRTRLFDGAAHCHNEACVPDQLGRKGLRMIRGDIYSTLSHHIHYDRVDPR